MEELYAFVSSCDEHGSWSPQPLSKECVRIACPFPPNITNGKLVENLSSRFMYGDVATYVCNPGYYEDEALLSLRCQVSQKAGKEHNFKLCYKLIFLHFCDFM